MSVGTIDDVPLTRGRKQRPEYVAHAKVTHSAHTYETVFSFQFGSGHLARYHQLVIARFSMIITVPIHLV